MSASNDGSESVDQFLARIASVKEGNDGASPATRRMDEEFLKGRQERQARRLERARSISPSKTGPAKTSSFSLDPATIDRALNPPVDFSPQAASLSRSNAVTGRTSPTRETDAAPSRSPVVPNQTEDPPAPQLTTGLARSGTLSWQQRPISRDGARSRPLSGYATVRASSRPVLDNEKQEEPSRKDIAASLSQKDPAWFKQTQDRGTSSAAYRKKQVDDTPETPLARSMQLPGMSRSREPSKSPGPDEKADRNESNEAGDGKIEVDRFKRGTTPDIAALRLSMREKPPQLRPSSQDNPMAQTMKLESGTVDDGTPNLARTASILSSNRSPSPTKGLGGFVESAMMKRSDSVSKRWSVRANTGLKRGDSVAGGRPLSLHNRGLSRDIPATRGDTPSSPLASSRPGSSHDREPDASPGVPQKRISQQTQATGTDLSKDTPTNIASTEQTRGTSRPLSPVDDSLLARSPSKTMDPRRWSPTKSTWLESALQQSEPPKPQPMKEEPPKWRIDLQRSKSIKGSRDVSPDKRPDTEQGREDLEAQNTMVTNKSVSPAPVLDTKNKAESTTTIVNPVRSKPTVIAKQVLVSNSAEAPPVTATKRQENLVRAHKDEDNRGRTSEKQESAASTNMTSSQEESASQEPGIQPVTPKEEDSVKDEKEIVLSTKPPVLKPKPQTPPKFDFRASLKTRGTGPVQTSGSEPEFKSVFGKLKRATTQNYVAPDELKGNILSGKAALNVTAGPVKSKRVDDFKESILAKKEEMKVAAPESHERAELPEKSEVPVPEALARRKTLSRPKAPDVVRLNAKPYAVPQMPAKPSAGLSHSSAVKPPLQATDSLNTVVSGDPLDISTKASSGMHDPKSSNQSPESKKDISSEKSPPIPPAKPAQSWQSLAKTNQTTAVSAPATSTSQVQKSPVADSANSFPIQADLPVGSKLAGRLNPNLAAMLSRGASPRPQASPSTSSENLSLASSALTGKTGAGDDSLTSLTHMTKGRARGPKRRGPKADIASTEPVSTLTPTTTVLSPPQSTQQEDESHPRRILYKSVQQAVADVPSMAQPKTIPKENAGMPSSREDPQPPASHSSQPRTISSTKPETSSSPAASSVKEVQRSESLPSKSSVQEVVSAKAGSTSPLDGFAAGTPKSKPIVASKSPELRKVSNPIATIENRMLPGPKPTTPRKPSWSPAQGTSPSQTLVPSAKKAPIVVDKPSKNIATPIRSESMPARNLNSDTDAVARSMQSKTHVNQGLGLKMSPSPQASKPLSKPRTLTPPPEPEVKYKRSQQPQHIKEVLVNYVGPISKNHERGDFDAQQFLTSMNGAENKIKTLQQTVHEITGDGKKTAMPPQQEHILFEESMYLITHKFSMDNGNSVSEVSLWCGDRVSDAAIDDAQLFCRRVARDHNTKLEVVKQGKENSKLIQALGGILITRRSKSSALYMLCGRRHLGHIVFDEVEMEASNLCPGYAYLISAQYGKLYLWKGKDADADEIGSARLIGNDLGLTGELEEVEQGLEPMALWDALGSRYKGQWSDDWTQRAKANGYPFAMYRIEHERPGMLTNLASSWGLKRAVSPAKQQTKVTCERLQPFSQSDLDTPAIHIIDAYRTLYIIVSRQCASKAAEFVSALYLAQDFAMLSPAIQDRPVLPSCYVVAGELPRDVTACFRKWSMVEGASLVGKDSICVPLEEVMVALDL